MRNVNKNNIELNDFLNDNYFILLKAEFDKQQIRLTDILYKLRFRYLNAAFIMVISIFNLCMFAYLFTQSWLITGVAAFNIITLNLAGIFSSNFSPETMWGVTNQLINSLDSAAKLDDFKDLQSKNYKHKQTTDTKRLFMLIPLVIINTICIFIFPVSFFPILVINLIYGLILTWLTIVFNKFSITMECYSENFGSKTISIN
ncbi:hypothetical protein [Lactobacillus johnsonii]|uniref:Uncharacterized protein n=1 Tax=Lactobacillus johnsonii TaxID=33959 RepID=A0A9X7T5F8_LACJH|nr:hypothetical protein [Lactobacillus johnsonii]QIA88539.1 hypothetical protein FEE39_09860 [Lactobacillus johnsonii]